MVVFHIDTKEFPASYVCSARVSPKIKMTSWRSSLPRFLKVSAGVPHLHPLFGEHARHQCKSLPMAAIEQYNAVNSPFRVFMNCAPVWLRLHVGCYIAGCESKLYKIDANPSWGTKLHKINPESNGQRFLWNQLISGRWTLNIFYGCTHTWVMITYTCFYTWHVFCVCISLYIHIYFFIERDIYLHIYIYLLPLIVYPPLPPLSPYWCHHCDHVCVFGTAVIIQQKTHYDTSPSCLTHHFLVISP